MKISRVLPQWFLRTPHGLVALVVALSGLHALAATFTTDTTLGPADTNYEGADIVITNCTLAVDGPHAFASLLVAPGGILTHSFSPSGSVSNTLAVLDETQFLAGTNPVTLANSNIVPASVSVRDSSGTMIYTNGVDYLLSSADGILTELQRTTNSTIPEGTNVLVSYNVLLGFVPAGLNLTVTGNVQVAAGGVIDANGRGYGAGLGTGAGRSGGSPLAGSGAGYGGLGGMTSSNLVGGNTYGLFSQPVNLGSGGGGGYGGPGASGGGLIQITAGGYLVINGSVSANGANATNSRSGGGSGGSIRLTGQALTGAGSITANGGSGERIHGGGGGAGRIALLYGGGSFGGQVTAFGGGGAKTGGAGTIYQQITGQNPLLTIDNGGRAGTNTLLALANSTLDVLIRGHAGVLSSGGWNLANLTIGSNSFLAPLPLSALNLTLSANLAIQPGGALLAEAMGPPTGPGAGRAFYDGLYQRGGGGGYGGYGANGSSSNASGGLSYGSQLSPVDFGSSGGGYLPTAPGGTGGGVIRLTAREGTLLVDGRISVNGGNGSGWGGGGGSGGSIWITGGTLLGSGSITANGGEGANSIGGGGGGGRIAITSSVDLFGGTISAYGGAGANWGGAGTSYLQRGDKSFELVLDNADNPGTNTPLQSAQSADLIIRRGAIGSANSSAVFMNLLVTSNAWLTPLFSYAPAASLNLNFTGNATIQAGGGIVADESGYASGGGLGAGRYYSLGSTNFCSGAGHGGYGGNSFGNYALGGSTYDSLTSPSQPGSGGGRYSGSSLGGPGGGVIRLTVTGTLEVDGRISADGGNGSGLGGGGGSGGSIWLSAGTLSGTGLVSANGGNGADALGGGGGGGLIFIPCNNNLFSGTIAALGGSGANWGGAGPVLVQVYGRNGQLVLDNAGHFAPAPLPPSSSSLDLILRNGAVAVSGSSINFANILIDANAWLVASNSSLSFLSATIRPGGGIIADYGGYAAGAGPGAGRSSGKPDYSCSGAGHGGYGGNGTGNYATGGTAYDSVTSPANPGSGGGTVSPSSPGGPGGGFFHLNVSGLLQNDGIISANGGNGAGLGGGGGSGGSIWINAGILSGMGWIAANGGDGAGSVGGGGGGGRIALYPNSGLFGGLISASGGAGANPGGAGTIYISGAYPLPPQLVLDNGGRSGSAPTPILPTTATADLVLRGGAVAFQQYSQTFANLSIGSNSWLIANPTPANNYPGLVNLTLSGNATIQPGGGIVTDGAGWAAGSGNGAGHYYYYGSTYPCSGGGHGGYGGMSVNNLASGGSTYDSTISPSSNGSGGGYYPPYSFGGAGGGSIRLTVNGTLQNAGIISANGGSGSGLGGGGGSGGSVWLTVGTLAGAGAISANGGNGADAIGGGGGGGRISISGKLDSFTGPISAYGGLGGAFGGAGTIYLKPYWGDSQLTIDNGGRRGTNTTFETSFLNLVVSGSAVAQWPSGSGSIKNLQVRSNSVLTMVASPSAQNLTVSGNATIEPGGSLSADGLVGSFLPSIGGGYNSYNGISGGGGHGGFGAGNPPGYGAAYGSIQSPTTAGSKGGNGSGTSGAPYGGSGGGAFHLQVNGTLAVQGRISAAGQDGQLNSGGGSGGSVWINAGILTGSGLISVNGGSGLGLGGGGGGGRVAIYYSSSSFAGQITAAGGGGYLRGGAGTVFIKENSPYSQMGELLVDNGGLAGTNTPLSTAFSPPTQPFNLTIANGAALCSLSTFPVLNNLTISDGGLLTVPAPRSNLDLLILNQANVMVGGAISADAKGFPQAAGPGAGSSNSGFGGGGGYGGMGGASAAGPGGPSYGADEAPADFGSGGGFGWGPPIGGSEGGGAIRLNVGGILTINGEISARGGAALQDNSGGGSGGSIWVTAGTLAGLGSFNADGDEGDPYGGGGGAGGRIAVYSRQNIFFGLATARGAEGFVSGAGGSVLLSNELAPLQVVAQDPSGIVSNEVGFVDFLFNAAPAPTSVIASAFSLVAPDGALSPASMSISMLSPERYRLSFPVQMLIGDYTVTAGTNVADLYGQHLAQPYTGSFTVALPVIQGVVTDTNGLPVPEVLLQPNNGFSAATTDTNGSYVLGFIPGSTFTVTPSKGTLEFVPASLSYSNVTASVSNQNYLAVNTVAPFLSTAVMATNLVCAWQALPGMTYQLYSSTNLADWTPCGEPILGTNGPVQIERSIEACPAMFFRVESIR